MICKFTWISILGQGATRWIPCLPRGSNTGLTCSHSCWSSFLYVHILLCVHRMGFSATNACNKVQLLTLRSLTTMEVKESESYSTTYERCSQKATVSERSTSSSSSGIVTDDCPFVSPPPCKRRPSSVLFTPRDRVNTLPDPPTGACVTEEDGLLIVNWNPVR